MKIRVFFFLLFLSAMIPTIAEEEEEKQKKLFYSMSALLQEDNFDRFIGLLDNTKEFKINYQDKNGDTLLIHAAKSGKINFCEKLLKKGSNINIRNNDGRSAIMVAAKNNKQETCRFLNEFYPRDFVDKYGGSIFIQECCPPIFRFEEKDTKKTTLTNYVVHLYNTYPIALSFGLCLLIFYSIRLYTQGPNN